MYGQNIDGKNLPPELTRSKANTKAIAFCRRKLRGLDICFRGLNGALKSVGEIETLCSILYHLYNLKNVKKTHREVIKPL